MASCAHLARSRCPHALSYGLNITFNRRAFSEWHCTLGDATWRGVALRYKNKRGWHALFHSDCQKGSTAGGAAGGHGYSADGKTWEFHPMNAYDNVLKLADGTTWTLNRRER